MSTSDERQPSEVERLAAAPRRSLARDLIAFAARTGKWWLLPILIALLVFSALAFFGSTGLAPFIYPLF